MINEQFAIRITFPTSCCGNHQAGRLGGNTNKCDPLSAFFWSHPPNLELTFNPQRSCRPRPSDVTFSPCPPIAEAITLILGRNTPSQFSL